MNPVLTHPDAIAVGLIRCADEVALTEARAVLADMPHHSDDQIADAARTLLCLSQDEVEWLQAYEALATIKRLELIPWRRKRSKICNARSVYCARNARSLKPSSPARPMTSCARSHASSARLPRTRFGRQARQMP